MYLLILVVMDKKTAEGWQMLGVKLLQNHFNKIQKGVVAVIFVILLISLFILFFFFPPKLF